MSNVRNYFGLTALAALAALGIAGGVSSVAAQTQTPTSPANTAPHPIAIAGKVQSVTTSGLVLQNAKQTYTVNVDANTWVVTGTGSGCAQGQLSDLATAKLARVEGMTTAAPNTVQARVVIEGRCLASTAAKKAHARQTVRKAIASHLAAGTITAINGGTLTLNTAANKTLTVNTVAGTVVFNNGFSTVSALKVGDKIQIFGRHEAKPAAANGSQATPRPDVAYAIHVEGANTQIMVGRVAQVNGTTLTVRTPANKAGITLTLDAAAGYKVLSVAGGTPSLANGSVSDVKVGSNILFETTAQRGAAAATTKAVIVLPAGKAKQAKP